MAHLSSGDGTEKVANLPRCITCPLVLPHSARSGAHSALKNPLQGMLWGKGVKITKVSIGVCKSENTSLASDGPKTQVFHLRHTSFHNSILQHHYPASRGAGCAATDPRGTNTRKQPIRRATTLFTSINGHTKTHGNTVTHMQA